MGFLEDAVSLFRQDAYVGSRRCWPCTALNVGLLAAAASLVGWAVGVPTGAAVLLAGLAAIWLRGYLVPYTPRITSRLVELSPVDRDPHRPSPPGPEAAAGRTTGVTDGGAGTETEDDLVDSLLTAGVLAADGGEISLESGFHSAWRAAIETSRTEESDPEALAGALAEAVPWVAEASVVADDGRRWVRLTDEDDVLANETWLSVPAAVADLTAVRTLAERTTLGARGRTLAAPQLRQFLERCPVCDEPLSVTSPQACCGSPRYVAEGVEAVLACPACDEVLATFESDPSSD